MYLAPIVKRIISKTDTYTLYQCWILLERNGTHLMSVGSAEEAAAFPAENGLASLSSTQAGDIILQEIQPEAALQDFYTWSETGPGPMREVWRPFLWCAPDTMGLAPALKEISVGPVTVADVLQEVFPEA